MIIRKFQILRKKTVIIMVLSGMLSGVAYNGGTPVWEDPIAELSGHESTNRSLVALTAPEQLPLVTTKVSPPDVLLRSIPSKAETPDTAHQVMPLKVKAFPPYFKMTRGPQRRAARVRDAHHHNAKTGSDVGAPGPFWEFVIPSPTECRRSSLFCPRQKKEDLA